MTDQRRPSEGCAATRRDGWPCRGAPLAGGLCFAHDPALADRRDAARRKGGAHRATAHRLNANMPPTVAGITDTVLTALDATARGDLAPARGQAVASLARAALAAHEQWDVCDRLDAVEAHLAAVRGAPSNGKVTAP